MASLKLAAPPAGPYFAGVAGVLDGAHAEGQRDHAERDRGDDGEHAPPAAQLEHLGANQS